MYSVSDKHQTLISEWNLEMQSFVPSWSAFCELITDDAAALRRWSDTPSGVMPTIDTALTNNTSITSTAKYKSVAEQTITPTAKGSGTFVHQLDTRFDSGLIDKRAESLLRSAQNTIEEGVFSFLAGGFNSLVDNANDSGGGETTSNIFSAYDPPPAAYPQAAGFHYKTGMDEASTNAQYSTKIATALSASGLSAAREMMRKQFTYNGVPAGFGMGNLALVVPIELEDEAIQATRSAELITTQTSSVTAATGATINPHSLRGYQIITSGYLSDSSDWFLVDASTQESPVKVWVPAAGAPKLNVWQNPNGNTELSVSFFMRVFIDAPVAGIVGSSVA